MNERKKNCWEYKGCGRQPQGHHVHDLGVCPAAVEKALDGIHGGANAGRACWIVAGTMCGGKVQGTFGAKYRNCERCDFYQSIRQDEKGAFILSAVLLNRLQTGRRSDS
jgi:hypothetical protein